MDRISVELVPRGKDALSSELAALGSRFAHLDTVNLPDLERFSLRSWEACALARPRFARAIPHLRARDVDLADLGTWVRRLDDHGLDTVIVVRGDPPRDPTRPDHPTTSLALIEALRSMRPTLRIYAALDPYRRPLRAEVEDATAKLEAGADGFFTQPFFDLRLADVWADAIGAGTDVYWGVSPVTRAGSQRYWEQKNGVVFPRTFETSLAANQRFGREVLAWARARGHGVYFMPIREDPVVYLEGVLDATG